MCALTSATKVHYRWSGMRKVNTHGRREKGGTSQQANVDVERQHWRQSHRCDGASPPGHPASYSPGYQRLQKKPKVTSYINSRPCTMLQAILLFFFWILSLKILSPVQRLLITKLPRCQKVSTPSPLGSRQGSPTPTNDFVSHHSSAPTTFLSPPPPLVGTMQGGEKIQKHVTCNFKSLLTSSLLLFCTLQYNSQKLWTDM